MTNIDLNQVSDHLDIDVYIKSRIKEEPEDANLRRFKERWLFIITMFSIFTAISVCILLICSNPKSSFSGIALNGLIGITMALAGYFVRGKN